jgi:hypothetical protein
MQETSTETRRTDGMTAIAVFSIVCGGLEILNGLFQLLGRSPCCTNYCDKAFSRFRPFLLSRPYHRFDRYLRLCFPQRREPGPINNIHPHIRWIARGLFSSFMLGFLPAGVEGRLCGALARATPRRHSKREASTIVLRRDGDEAKETAAHGFF